MPTISLFFFLLSTSLLLAGGITAWLFLDRSHRRRNAVVEMRMTRQVLQHSALCEELEARIAAAIDAFDRNEETFQSLLSDRNVMIVRLEAAVSRHEAAAGAARPGAGTHGRAATQVTDAATGFLGPGAMDEESTALPGPTSTATTKDETTLADTAFRVVAWEQRIEQLQAEKQAELARQSETIANLTERMESLGRESRQAVDVGERFSVELDEWEARYAELEERSADEVSQLTDALESARDEASRAASSERELEDLRRALESERARKEAADKGSQADLTAVQAELDDLAAQYEEQGAQLTEAAALHVEHQAQIEHLRAFTEEMEAEAGVVRAQRDALDVQVTDLLEVGATFEERTVVEREELQAALEAERDARESLGHELTAAVETLDLEREHGAEVADSSAAALGEARSQVDELLDMRDRGQIRLAELESRSSALEGELEDALARGDSLAQDLEVARAAQHVAREQGEFTSRDYESRLTVADRERSELNGELLALRAKREQEAVGHARLVESARADGDERDALRVRTASLEKDLGLLREAQQLRATEVDGQVADLEGRVQETHADLVAANEREAGIRQELARSRSTADGLQDHVSQLEEQLAQLGAEREGLNEDLARQAGEIEAMDQDLDRRRTQVVSLEAVGRETATALEQSRDGEAAAAAELAEVRESLATASDDRQRLTETVSEHRVELEELRDAHALRGEELAQARHDLVQNERSRAELREQVREHTLQGASLAEELVGLHADLENKDSELSSALDTVAERDSSFEAAQGLLADLGPIFETLQSQLEKRKVLEALQSKLGGSAEE